MNSKEAGGSKETDGPRSSGDRENRAQLGKELQSRERKLGGWRQPNQDGPVGVGRRHDGDPPNSYSPNLEMVQVIGHASRSSAHAPIPSTPGRK